MADILGGSNTFASEDSTDSMPSTSHASVEDLRRFCETELGAENFLLAYNMLMDSDRLSDGETAVAPVTGMFGFVGLFQRCCRQRISTRWRE
jgi:hypothetical protein